MGKGLNSSEHMYTSQLHTLAGRLLTRLDAKGRFSWKCWRSLPATNWHPYDPSTARLKLLKSYRQRMRVSRQWWHQILVAVHTKSVCVWLTILMWTLDCSRKEMGNTEKGYTRLWKAIRVQWRTASEVLLSGIVFAWPPETRNPDRNRTIGLHIRATIGIWVPWALKNKLTTLHRDNETRKRENSSDLTRKVLVHF